MVKPQRQQVQLKMSSISNDGRSPKTGFDREWVAATKSDFKIGEKSVSEILSDVNVNDNDNDELNE